MQDPLTINQQIVSCNTLALSSFRGLTLFKFKFKVLGTALSGWHTFTVYMHNLVFIINSRTGTIKSEQFRD